MISPSLFTFYWDALGIVKYEGHPALQEDWRIYRTRFKEKTNSLWNTVKNNSSNRSSSTYREALKELLKKLKAYETSTAVGAPAEPGFSSDQKLQIIERLERSEEINKRNEEILRQLDRLTDSGSSQERSRWRGVERQYKQNWQNAIESFDRNYGWDRWDPASLSQEQHRNVLNNIASLLRETEASLEITPPVSDIEFAERFADEFQTMTVLKESAAHLYSAGGRRMHVDLLSNREVREQHNLDSPQNFHFVFSRADGSAVTEHYAAGKISSRTSVYNELGEKVASTFHWNGAEQSRNSYQLKEGNWKLLRYETFFDSGIAHAVSDTTAGHAKYNDDLGNAIIFKKYSEDRSKTSAIRLIDPDGNFFDHYSKEKQNDPSLTPSKYLDALARTLNTHGKMHQYFKHVLLYTSDNGDYWQQSSETIARERNGHLLGDCDDYAFLARDILRRQNSAEENKANRAYVLSIPKHAICVWVTKRPDGRYNAYSIGTFGYDKNGNRFGRKHDSDKDKGYATVIEALNSLMLKYKYDGLGLSEGQDYKLKSNNISILHVPSRGQRSSYNVQSGYFLRDR